MHNKLLKASFDKYEAQKSEAIAHLDILFKNSVGIGEHTDILAEVDKWVKSLAEADENLEITQEIIKRLNKKLKSIKLN